MKMNDAYDNFHGGGSYYLLLIKIITEITISNKAGQVLKNHIMLCVSAKQTQLLKFCETRWG